jgi:hypothetical protein
MAFQFLIHVFSLLLRNVELTAILLESLGSILSAASSPVRQCMNALTGWCFCAFEVHCGTTSFPSSLAFTWLQARLKPQAGVPTDKSGLF